MLLRPATLLLPGTHDFWHTEGNRILDTNNHAVRISGVNWSGLETVQAVPGGLDSRDYRAILRTIKQNGYNTVRIPFSNEMIETPTIPEHVSYSSATGPINADLRNLNSLEILDRIIAYAGKLGLKVILDDHRSEAGSSAQESGLWYTAQYSESAWIEDWSALTTRYKNNSTVIGMDLRNEPHNAEKGGACWDCGGSNDWHRAASRAGDAILAINPHLLIFVEGVDSYAGDTYWWGGNLEGVRRSPVHLSVANRLVYSAHEYGPAEYSQAWFNSATSEATLASVWRRHWAFISEAGIAPVWIGEFGTTNNDADVWNPTPGSEGQWFASLIGFFGSHPALGWTYWGVNGEDRYGLLDLTYSSQPANSAKTEALASIQNASPARARMTRADTLAIRNEYPPATSTQFEPVSKVTSMGAPTGRLVEQIPAPATSGIPHVESVRRSTREARSRGKRVETSLATSIDGAIASSVRNAVNAANQRIAAKSGRL